MHSKIATGGREDTQRLTAGVERQRPLPPDDDEQQQLKMSGSTVSQHEGGAILGNASFSARKELRRQIQERDFYQGGDGTLLPNSFEPRHKAKPSKALSDALEFRKHFKQQRGEAMAAARDQSAVLRESLSAENVLADLRAQTDARDEKELVGKFMSGYHWLHDDAKLQHKDLQREEKLHEECAKLISDSPVIQSDFEMGHIGRVVLPTESASEKVMKEKQGEYIDRINSRMDLFRNYKSFIDQVAHLQTCIDEQEEEIRSIRSVVDIGRHDNNFDWQMVRNNRVIDLDAKSAVDREDLEYAKVRLKGIRKEIYRRFPEMSSALLNETAGVANDADDDLANNDAQEDDAFRDTGKRVYGWVIGRLTSDGKICCILFGQFSREVEPPAEDWIFVGKNVDRNLVSTSHSLIESVITNGIASNASQMTSLAEVDYVIMDADMQVAKKDVVKIKKVMVSDGSYKANVENAKPLEYTTFQVENCSLDHINGRYLDSGIASHVPKYKNVRGWALFRCTLMEIPDLGIFAENCYSALKGPSISDALDRRAEQANKEMVDRHSTVMEGTVQFKRRFAEMARAGQRIINTDQTLQLLRNEDLRAEARNESDNAMMMILQAVMGHKEAEAEGDEAAPKVTANVQTLLETIEEVDGEGEGDPASSSYLLSPTSKDSRSSSIRTKKTHKNVRSKSELMLEGSDAKTESDEGSINIKGFVTGIDLDIQVTLSKGIHYQTGSQGFPLMQRKTFLEEESELSSIVTKYIEAREMEIFTLRVEAEQVNRVFLEAEELSKDMDVDKVMGKLLQQMRVVREATINVTEALGAWARLCHREKTKKMKTQYDGSSAVQDAKAQRRYCVSIAFKGPIIYPQSKEMKSSSGKFTRGLEHAKRSIDVQYIGEYDTREEAVAAFGLASSKIPPEKVLHDGSGGGENKVLVGMRSCRKHYLVRSSSVPNDGPCEACTAIEFARYDGIVSPAHENAVPLQQFIWHGKNYLEKMWGDVDFLRDNILLQKFFPDLDLTYNPFLLTNGDYNEVLSTVASKIGDGLTSLRGRREQVRDAKKAGTIVPKSYTGYEMMGIPLGAKPNQRVDIDREANLLELARRAEKDYVLAGSLEMTTASSAQYPPPPVSPNQQDQHLADTLDVRPAPVPPQTFNGLSQSKGKTSTDGGGNVVVASKVSLGPIDLFTPWSSLSPQTALDTPQTLGRTFPPAGVSLDDTLEMHMYRGRANVVQNWLREDPLDFVGRNRLNRALYVLGQSSTLTKEKLPQAVLTDELKGSVLDKKRGLLLSSRLLSEEPISLVGRLKKKSNYHGGDLGGVESHDDKLKSVDTEVGYYFRGANFSMPQMRVPNAGRVDDVFCKVDAGEWYGMSKGRAMRSFEFNERILQEGREKNAARKKCQFDLKQCMETDIVYTDVAMIKRLIALGKELRGSVLALDIIQAEQFLKYRRSLLKSILKMQCLQRGNVSRKRVKKLKEIARAAKRRAMLMEQLSISMSRDLAPKLIAQGCANALAYLIKRKFRISANLSGVLVVITVSEAARRVKKGFELCASCNGVGNSPEKIVQVYDRSKKAFHSERAACTCSWVHSGELWRLRVFEPMTKRTIVRFMTMEQLRDLIEGIVSAWKLLEPSHVKKCLIGESFGILQPLFFGSKSSFEGHQGLSHSLASRRAAEQSSILPLLPKALPAELLNAIRLRQNLTIDRVRPHGFKSTKGPLAVTNIDALENSKPLPWLWEPIADWEYSLRHIEAIKRHEIILQERVEASVENITASDQALTRIISTAVEWLPMEYEDARTRFIRTDENLELAAKRIKAVMNYSQSTFAAFSAEERNESEDWKQSYEEFEDGSAWANLNNKRKLEKLWHTHLQEYHDTCARIPAMLVEHKRLIEATRNMRVVLVKSRIEKEAYFGTLDEAIDVSVDTQRLVKQGIKAVMSTFCMPRKGKPPNSRKIRHVPYELVFVRDPRERARKQYIGAWNFLESKILALRRQLGNSYSVLRCVVEVFSDPLTGYFIIRVGGQEDLPMEESTQHLDMGIEKEELSDLTSHALENDILLRPNDVKVILSKSPDWPATHMKKKDHMFKTIDSFVRADLNEAPRSGDSVLRSDEEQQQHAGIDEETSKAPKKSSVNEKLEIEEWIPPSKRPRNLGGVTSFPSKCDTTSGLPVSYAARAKKKEDTEREKAKALLKYLRLQPHTGKPCLGLVHFVRRSEYCSVRIVKCTWFRDLAKTLPSTWCNELASELRYVCRRLVQSVMRGCLEHFELSLRSPISGLWLGLQVQIMDAVRVMAINSPLLLASMLCEIVVNRVSAETHNLLLDFVDVQMTEEKSTRFLWRKAMHWEMPRLEFLGDNKNRYRGPIYGTHRFLAGRYFRAVFFISSKDDFRFLLKPPIDGNFGGHAYSGKDIVVDILRDELRAFVAKAALRSELVSSRYRGNVDLLHPNNWIDLFPLLLETVILESIAVVEPNQVESEKMTDPIEESSLMGSLIKRVTHVAQKFNAWAARTDGRAQPLSQEIIDETSLSIKKINQAGPWRLKLKKDDQSRKLVEVRSEVWSALEPERFHGEKDQDAFHRARLVKMRTSKWGMQAKHLMESLRGDTIIDTSGLGVMSFWSVRFLTDESKNKFFIDLKPSDLSNSVVQCNLAEEELLLMAEEEALSIRSEKAIWRKEQEQLALQESDEIKRHLYDHLMPAFSASKKACRIAEEKISISLARFTQMLDEWILKRAAAICEGARKSIRAEATTDLLCFNFPPLQDVVTELLVNRVPKGEKKRRSSTKTPSHKVETNRSSVPSVLFSAMALLDVATQHLISDTKKGPGFRLLLSSSSSGQVSRRAPGSKMRFTDAVQPFTSATIPRYESFAGPNTGTFVSQNFRDAGEWKRKVFSFTSSRDSRVVNIGGRLFLTSDPVLGPMDLAGFKLYDPSSEQTWSAVVEPENTSNFPNSCLLLQSQTLLESSRTPIVPTLQVETSSLIRACSERIVWKVLVQGVANTIVSRSIEQLRETLEGQEDQITELVDRLNFLDEHLALVAEVERLNVVDSSVEVLVSTVPVVAPLPVGKPSLPLTVTGYKELLSFPPFVPSDFGIKVYGVMIPADEALAEIPIEAFAQDWTRVCAYYLGEGTPLERTFTLSAFVSTVAVKHGVEDNKELYVENPRLNRWIREYSEHLGWRADCGHMRHLKSVLERNFYVAKIRPLCGDAVLMLRRGREDVTLVRNWLKERYEEYEPMRELRRQKEGREREYRMSNHVKYRDNVFSMAEKFVKGMNIIYDHRGSMHGFETWDVSTATKPRERVDDVTLYSCRVLVSRFLTLREHSDLLEVPVKDKVDSDTILDEAFLIDTDVAHASEEMLMRFDVLPDESTLSNRETVLKWDPNKAVLGQKQDARHDLQPRAGQLMYAIYKLHCFACTKPSNLCHLPGCGQIRCRAAADVQLSVLADKRNKNASINIPSFGEVGVHLVGLFGTGRHPLERSIRMYLLEGREYFNALLPVAPFQREGMRPEEEIADENRMDMQERARLDQLEYLKINWRALEVEAHQFRYLKRRILRKELEETMSAEDILEAGSLEMDRMADEAFLSQSKVDEMIKLIPPRGRGNTPLFDTSLESGEQVPRQDAQGLGCSDEDESAVIAAVMAPPESILESPAVTAVESASRSITGGLIEIPKSIVLELLGGCGIDGHGNKIPLWAIDPYPAEHSENSTECENDAGIRHPMAVEMYKWLVDHLRVSRPIRLPESSGDRGQYLVHDVSLKLDRQHCEGSVRLVDGSIVVVQLLHGTLSGVSLCADSLSGTPPGAIRFCPAHILHLMRPGLTIVVYDMRGGVSRAVAVEGRALSRAAEAFGISDSDTPLIARHILQHASVVIRLGRIGEQCTSISLDVNGIYKPSQNRKVEEKKQTIKVRPHGRRQFVKDARNERLHAAKRFLQTEQENEE